MSSLRYVNAGTFHKVAKFSQSILDTWMPKLLQVVLPSRAESTGESWSCWGPIIDRQLICFLPPRQDCNWWRPQIPSKCWNILSDGLFFWFEYLLQIKACYKRWQLRSTFLKFVYFLIGGQLLYNIMLVSVIHQHESAIGIHTFPPSWTALPPPPPATHPTPLGFHRALSLSSLGHIANSHWLSIFHMVM